MNRKSYLGGVTRDPQTGKFIDTGKEETKVLGVRLPISLIEEINQIPNKSEWLKDVLSKAVSEVNNDN